MDSTEKPAIVRTGANYLPPISEMKAIKEVAQPITQGNQALAGRKKDKERRYRRIFKELRLSLSEEIAYHKADYKRLKAIKKSPLVAVKVMTVSSAIFGAVSDLLLAGEPTFIKSNLFHHWWNNIDHVNGSIRPV